jgi:hypothetical protein
MYVLDICLNKNKNNNNNNNNEHHENTQRNVTFYRYVLEYMATSRCMQSTSWRSKG